MGSMECALLVPVFFQGRWVHWVAHWRSFRDAGLIGVYPGGRRVRSGTLDSLGSALDLVTLVRSRCVHLVGPWGSSGSFWFAGFIGVGRGGPWNVRGGWDMSWGSSGSLGVAELIVVRRSFGVAGFIGVRRGGRRVRYWGAPSISSGSFGVAAFI